MGFYRPPPPPPDRRDTPTSVIGLFSQVAKLPSTLEIVAVPASRKVLFSAGESDTTSELKNISLKKYCLKRRKELHL